MAAETTPTLEERKPVLIQETVDTWHGWIRDALGLPADAPRRFDYYADELARLKAENEGLRTQVQEYQRLAIDAEDTALQLGSRWGLCDAIASDGTPYPSAWADNLLKLARREIVDSRALTRADTEVSK